MHPAHETVCDASAFSDPDWGLWLVRGEWYSLPLALDITDGETGRHPTQGFITTLGATRVLVLPLRCGFK